MIIVKMNESTVECSIAASELRELGLTPESIMTGASISESFMSQLNKEVGQQLGFNPDTEVMLMSKNLMADGGVRIFVVKMSNEDIQKTADRIKKSANAMLETVNQEKIDYIKSLSSAEKAESLGKLLTDITEKVNNIYVPEEYENAKVTATVKNMSKYDSYMLCFDSIDEAVRLSLVVNSYPIRGSRLYKLGDEYYLALRVKNTDDKIIFEFRKTAIEYSKRFIYDSPEETHIVESGELIIAANAIKRLCALKG